MSSSSKKSTGLAPLDTSGALKSALDHSFVITTFRSVQAKAGAEDTTTLRRLATQHDTTVAPTKTQLPLLKGARFKKGAGRTNAGMICVTMVEGDHDAGTMSPQQAANALAVHGLAGLIAPTPSHTPDKPRWRAWLPLSRDYPPEHRDVFAGRLNGALGGVLAPESWVRSQPFYCGRLAGSPPWDTHLVDGDFIDLRADLDTIAIGRAGRPARAGASSGTHAGHDRGGERSPQAAVFAAQLAKHHDRFTPAVRATIAETPHGQRHIMLTVILARLVSAGWPDPDAKKLVLDAGCAAWPDATDLEDRVDKILRWVREREAMKHGGGAMTPTEARIAAAFGGRGA